MTSNHHAPDLGYTLQWLVNESQAGDAQANLEPVQSDCRLQPPMKSESLVIGSARRGEYVPRALYTPPVTPREFVTPEVGEVTCMSQPPMG